MSIGSEIRKARLARGLSQAALARLVGCHEDSVLHWEKEEVKPLPIFREKLEKILGITLKEDPDDGGGKYPPE